MKEQYIPTPEEAKKAEDSMSDSQKEQSSERENFLKIRETISEYKEKDIARISKLIIEQFHFRIKNIEKEGGMFDPDPSGYREESVLYRNLVYALTYGSGSVAEGDDLNYSLYGLAIKKSMDMDQDFDKFMNDYISKAKDADKKAWERKDEQYKKAVEWEKEHGSDFLPEYLLNPNEGRYTQGKYLEKYILGNI